MRSSPRPATFFQSPKASSSSVKTVAFRRSLGEPELAGQELPAIGDGVRLEVVAEREVAQHLEEGVVPRGAPDVLEIVVLAARAHALLRGGGADVLAALLSQEHRLELHHAGVGEEERRVLGGHERRGTDHGVAVPLKVCEEASAEIVSSDHHTRRGAPPPFRTSPRIGLRGPSPRSKWNIKLLVVLTWVMRAYSDELLTWSSHYTPSPPSEISPTSAPVSRFTTRRDEMPGIAAPQEVAGQLGRRAVRGGAQERRQPASSGRERALELGRLLERSLDGGRHEIPRECPWSRAPDGAADCRRVGRPARASAHQRAKASSSR